MKEHTGAKRVLVFDHTIRRGISKEQMEGNFQDEKSVVNRPEVLLVIVTTLLIPDHKESEIS